MPVPIASRVRALATGVYHSLLLTIQGTVLAAGANTFGQLGVSGIATSLTFIRVPIAGKVRSVAAGVHHSLFLLDTGAPMAAGGNEFGQLGTHDSSLVLDTVPV